jgi:Cyclic nucleotide-binding domain
LCAQFTVPFDLRSLVFPGFAHMVQPKHRGKVMPTLSETLPQLVHVGSILYLICFLFRDQLLLRSFAIAGDVAFVLYYFNVAEEPLWGAIFWNIPNIGINLVMIALILRDRRTASFSENELKLYGLLPSVEPSEFRKLLRVGKWLTAQADTVLTREGDKPDHLYFVLEGGIDIEKNGRKIPTESGIFIGEIAFLSDLPATATVTITPGSLYFSWPRAALQKARDNDQSLAVAIGSILNVDLAGKLARTSSLVYSGSGV